MMGAEINGGCNMQVDYVLADFNNVTLTLETRRELVVLAQALWKSDSQEARDLYWILMHKCSKEFDS